MTQHWQSYPPEEVDIAESLCYINLHNDMHCDDNHLPGLVGAHSDGAGSSTSGIFSHAGRNVGGSIGSRRSDCAFLDR